MVTKMEGEIITMQDLFIFKHEGWTAVNNRYDDGGYSGGTMERPALKQLLDDILAGKLDTIVVYKVDRLTGDVLPALSEKHDHCWDAARYALEVVIQAGKPAKKTSPDSKRRDGWADDEKHPQGWRVV